jgi:hypothetical protein
VATVLLKEHFSHYESMKKLGIKTLIRFGFAGLGLGFAFPAFVMADVCIIQSMQRVIAGPPGYLLVQGTFGWVRSVDGGKSWESVSVPAGKGGADVFKRYAPSVVDHTLFVADEQSLYRSRDWGKTWDAVGTPHYGLAIDTKGRLYGCSRYGEQVDMSDNDGASWAAGRPLVDSVPLPYQTDDGVPISMWSNFCSKISAVGKTLYVPYSVGILRSVDQGKTWEALPVPNMQLAVSFREDPVHSDADGNVYLSGNFFYRPEFLSYNSYVLPSGSVRWQYYTWPKELTADAAQIVIHAKGDTMLVASVVPNGYPYGFESNFEMRKGRLFLIRGNAKPSDLGIDFEKIGGALDISMAEDGTVNVLTREKLFSLAAGAKDWFGTVGQDMTKSRWNSCGN